MRVENLLSLDEPAVPVGVGQNDVIHRGKRFTANFCEALDGRELIVLTEPSEVQRGDTVLVENTGLGGRASEFWHASIRCPLSRFIKA